VPANTIPAGRSLAFLLASVLVMDACAGGGSARDNTDSSSASAGGQPAEMRRTYVATAGSEAMGSEWTATVRPLGDGGSAPPRELPGSESIPSSSDAAAPGPIQLSQAQNNPAVASLLSTANSQSQAGDHARAAATLERAIAIEPNNAWLWHYLAAARLREGRLDQAASLAAKSNSLTATDRPLQINNWKLIAAVRRHQGDAGAAAAAESRAAALLK
jgi:tetratricopeptide (TPR) repeat protein